MMGFPVRRSWPSHHPTRPVPACRAASTRQPPSKASAECYQNISRRNRATDRSPLEAPAVPGGGPDSAQSRAVRSNGHLALVGEIGHGTLRLGQGRERGGDVFSDLISWSATTRASRWRRPLPPRGLQSFCFKSPNLGLLQPCQLRC